MPNKSGSPLLGDSQVAAPDCRFDIDCVKYKSEKKGLFSLWFGQKCTRNRCQYELYVWFTVLSIMMFIVIIALLILVSICLYVIFCGPGEQDDDQESEDSGGDGIAVL